MDVTPVKVGDAVEYVDPVGTAHTAIITAVWGEFGKPDTVHDAYGSVPGLNLVYIDDDEAKTDTYGRQIARDTSVVHETMQTAHGRFWRNLKP